MKKTIFFLSLLFAMAFVFFGCNDEQDVSIDGVVTISSESNYYDYYEYTSGTSWSVKGKFTRK